MPRFHPEAAAFCVLWALLALGGWSLIGWKTGVALSAGLLPVFTTTSAAILSRTGSFQVERGVRWGILALAAIVVLTWVSVGGDGVKDIHNILDVR